MNSKKLNIVLGFVVIVLLAIVGYMALRDNSKTDNLTNSNLENTNNPQPLNSTKTETQSTNNTPTTNPNQIVGWKTYDGSAEGVKYQVSYPNDWRAVEQTNSSTGFGPRSLGAEVVWEISPENSKSRLKSTIIADLEEDAKKNGNVVNKDNISLPSGVATRLSVSKPDTDFSVQYIVIQVGDIVYTMSASQQLGIEESFEQFYKSFTIVK